MAYLIDGNNFIGHTSPHNLRDPQSKYALVSKLRIFHYIKKTKVILVFDGNPDPNLTGEKFRDKALSVIFPFGGQNADEVIKEIILKQSDLRRFFVVSSDREIKSFARSKGANPLSCIEFNRELKAIMKEYRKSLEKEKNVTLPSPLEINQWLNIFRNKK